MYVWSIYCRLELVGVFRCNCFLLFIAALSSAFLDRFDVKQASSHQASEGRLRLQRTGGLSRHQPAESPSDCQHEQHVIPCPRSFIW